MVVCTPTKKAQIFHMQKYEGKTFQEIRNILGVSRSAASRTYSGLEKQGPRPNFYARPPIPGQPRAISPHAEQRACRLIRANKCRNATEVQHKLFPDLHPTTVRCMFIQNGLPGRVCRKKPYFLKPHTYKQFGWVSAMREKPPFFWHKVWFTDELKFNLFGSDGRIYCCRGPGEEFSTQIVSKTVKHSGENIQVWGCLSYHGPGCLHHINGCMDSNQYTSILQESFLGSLQDRKVQPHTIIFQQDNDPKHKSKLATNWFRQQNIELLPWPPSSPNMNILEHAWDEVDCRIQRREVQPRNLEELWVALQEEWVGLEVSYIRKLYESIPC
ncbi:hypothetical protein NMY22_g13810 [Coprinellus aureogranulatus]|nr:hypothetical protein NMY22_g13810 [Coprinellus aureogranulatus]